jgi:hypothetical protein
MLPAAVQPERKLADVADNVLSALTGQRSSWGFAPVKKAVIVLADGMGAHQLAGAAGHARVLTRRLAESGFSGYSGLPSTTSSALASLTTGADSGTHGLVGYQVRDPLTRAMVNHLKPFPDGVSVERWQSVPTVFERAADQGIASLAVGESRFAGTDFSEAVLRGARFEGSNRLHDHLHLMRTFFDAESSGLVYLYWPTLDRMGHSQGVASEAWVAELEAFDRFVSDLSGLLTESEAAIVTADHGMVDVMPADQWVMPASHPVRASIDRWAGEPRCLHLYFHHPDSGVAEELTAWVGPRGVVLPREEAINRGAFGAVSGDNRDRVGDVVVFAHNRFAFYDEATSPAASYGMVGQHGSLTPEETIVPMVPLGAWAR